MQDNIQPKLSVNKPYYFPIANGRYEVKPGLFKFPHDFGNGVADRLYFQFDDLFGFYRQEKLAAKKGDFDNYYCCTGTSSKASSTTNRLIVEKLIEEQPTYFQKNLTHNLPSLKCRLTNEELFFDKHFCLSRIEKDKQSLHTYTDTLDAPACPLQEDLAIVKINSDGDNEISAIHLCFSNHWAAKGHL